MTVTDENAAGSPRMQEFEREISQMKIRGQDTGPEGRLLTIGLVAMAIGIAFVLYGWFGASGAEGDEFVDAISYMAGASLGGVALAVIGAALYVRAATARYLRYWLMRLVYEQREQTDRIIEALQGSKR